MAEPVNPNAFKRRNAYVTAMDRLGKEPELIQATGLGWSFEEIGFQGGAELFADKAPRYRTILCSNDRLAIGLLSSAYEHGLRVGLGEDCDVRIAGHDDHPFARFTCPSLTTVAQDYQAIARRCVETLSQLVDSEDRTKRGKDTLFPGKLIMRNSA
jgi:DNA-binding LacI/PurR family transcriptional regulator